MKNLILTGVAVLLLGFAFGQREGAGFQEKVEHCMAEKEKNTSDFEKAIVGKGAREHVARRDCTAQALRERRERSEKRSSEKRGENRP